MYLESLLGAAIGGLMVLIAQKYFEWRAAQGVIQASKDYLRAEISVCGTLARTFLTDNVQAPLYRLPTVCFVPGVEALLRHGELKQGPAESLIRFYGEVAALNRGLDDAAELAFTPGTGVTMNAITERNRLKAERVKDGGDLYVPAIAAVSQVGLGRS